MAELLYQHLQCRLESGVLVIVLKDSQISGDELAEALRQELLAAVSHFNATKIVIDFHKVGSMATQSHPTYDHSLPLLYCLGTKTDTDTVTTFNDNSQWPAVSM